ncbi:MAG: hypothetical protein ACK47B_20880 [Armatimonadota bacterium]
MRRPTVLTALRVTLGSLALLAGWPSAASADQLIQVPTADRVTDPTFEYKRRLDEVSEGYGTALINAGLAYELMFRYYDNEDGQHRIEGGGMLQLLPDGVITPGVALGVWDLTNSSPWGRRGFLVLSKSLRPGQLGIPEGVERVQLTLGLGTGRLSGVFAGVRVDVAERVSLIAEYDARRLNAGLWVTLLKPLTFKAELQNGNPYLGGELRLRF